MTLTSRDRRRVLRARTLTWGGIVAACVLFFAAMSWYPGDGDSRGVGYSLGWHFLSVMGKTRAGASDNTVSCLIFNGTLLLIGAVMVAFWKTRAAFLTRPAAASALRGCGSLMGLTLAGIGLTPYDFFPHAHNLMTYGAVVFGVICFGLCAIGSHRGFESGTSRLAWLALLMVAAAAQAVVALLVSLQRIPSLPALPLMQKVFVLLLALWAGWQAFLFDRACRMAPVAAAVEDDGRM